VRRRSARTLHGLLLLHSLAMRACLDSTLCDTEYWLLAENRGNMLLRWLDEMYPQPGSTPQCGDSTSS
jgi:hypothetical protein